VPRVSTVFAASASGNGFEILSGGSMAARGVPGAAILTQQVRPDWSVANLRATVVRTANPSLTKDLLQRSEGARFGQATITVNNTELARSLSSGVLVLARDNISGAARATLLPCHEQNLTLSH
jgi:minor extracellular serine protease Vpr